MLIEMVENRCNIEEELMTIQSEMNKNIQGTNSEGKETRIQINDLEQKEEINFQQEQNEKPEFKKMRRGLGTSGTILNLPASVS